MKSICKYQGQFLEWDDDMGEEIETLKCTFFTDEGEWDEYCYCDEEERDNCKLYKYSKYIKEKNEEIERLQEEIEGLHQGIEILNKRVQEEKRLKQRYIEGYNYLKEENQRLQNIIDELEKYIKKNINDINAYFENTPFGVEDTYKEILEKLKELKEGNKDE